MTEREEVARLGVKMDRALKDIEDIMHKMDKFISSHTEVVESLSHAKKEIEKHAGWITRSTRGLIGSFGLLIIESIFIFIKFFVG